MLNIRQIFRRNKAAAAALILLGVFLFAAIFADFIAPFDPLKSTNDAFQPPSLKYIFGTDDLGRDVLSGVIYGARTSVLIGVSVALLSGLIGT